MIIKKTRNDDPRDNRITTQNLLVDAVRIEDQLGIEADDLLGHDSEKSSRAIYDEDFIIDACIPNNKVPNIGDKLSVDDCYLNIIQVVDYKPARETIAYILRCKL